MNEVGIIASAANIGAGGGGGEEEDDDMTVAIVSLTASQINHLFTSPHTIDEIPAPGAGTAIFVYKIVKNIKYGTANLSDGGHAPKMRYGDASGPILTPIDFDFNADYILDEGFTQGFTGIDPALVDNKQLVLADVVDGIDFGHVTTITIANGGSGYDVGDEFTINDTAGSGAGFGATYVVDTVGGGGAVQTFHQTDRGSSYQVANGYETDSGDGGTGLTVNITAIAAGDGSAQLIIFYNVIDLLP